jgi:thiol-disulfide isomerase/thioredoxin
LAACSAPPSYRGEFIPAVLAPAPPPDAGPADPVVLQAEDALPVAGDLRVIRAERAVASPAFAFVDDFGVRHTPASLSGRVVRLEFWATWCATCKAEFPDLQRMHERWADDGLTLLAVCRGSKPEDFTRAVRKDWISFATSDASDDKNFPFPIGAFPTTVLLDREGRVRSFWEGWREPKDVDEIVGQLLAEVATERIE